MSEMKPFRMVRKDGSLSIRAPKNGVSYRDLYHDLLRQSWPRFALTFATLFFLINALFGLLYFIMPAAQFEGMRNTEGFYRYLDCFFFSVQTLGTIGYGHVSPVGVMANLAVTLECYTGLFVVAVITGLIFARFAKPNVKVVFSRVAVIRKFDGIPCLMFRVANERQSYITDARVRLHLVMQNPNTGYRDFLELKLERDSSPVFALSWTIAHDIDHESPLFGLSTEELKSRSAEIIATFSGTDTMLSQVLHSKSSYITDEILMDHDFVDVIERHPDQTVSLMLDRFHEVRPIQ